MAENRSSIVFPVTIREIIREWWQLPPHFMLWQRLYNFLVGPWGLQSSSIWWYWYTNSEFVCLGSPFSLAQNEPYVQGNKIAKLWFVLHWHLIGATGLQLALVGAASCSNIHGQWFDISAIFCTALVSLEKGDFVPTVSHVGVKSDSVRQFCFFINFNEIETELQIYCYSERPVIGEKNCFWQKLLKAKLFLNTQHKIFPWLLWSLCEVTLFSFRVLKTMKYYKV